MTLPTSPTSGVRTVAAAALIVEIAIHGALAPDHLHEIPYIGAGFVLASVLLTAALLAIVVAPRRALGWQAGTALCIGMAVLFVVSRTVGLPAYDEAWTSDAGLGLAALPPELVFVWCAWTVGPLFGPRTGFARLHAWRPPNSSPATSPRSGIPSPSTRSGRPTTRW
jgi:hypothetical protein